MRCSFLSIVSNHSERFVHEYVYYPWPFTFLCSDVVLLIFKFRVDRVRIDAFEEANTMGHKEARMLLLLI